MALCAGVWLLVAACSSAPPPGGGVESSRTAPRAAHSAPFVVASTWTDCDDACWRRKRLVDEPPCDASGAAWTEAESALERAVSDWLQERRPGQRIDFRRSRKVRFDWHLIPSARDVEEKGAIAHLRVTAAAGWMDIKTPGFHGVYCIDIHRGVESVRLVPRVTSWVDF